MIGASSQEIKARDFSLEDIESGLVLQVVEISLSDV